MFPVALQAMEGQEPFATIDLLTGMPGSKHEAKFGALNVVDQAGCIDTKEITKNRYHNRN